MAEKTYSCADFLSLRDQAIALPGVHIEAGRHIWIFGAGNFGRSLATAMQAQGIVVEGFVETSPGVTSVLDLPVLNWSQLASEHPQAQLALGIFNRDTPYDELLGLVAGAGFAPPLMPWMLYEQFSQALGWRFWLGARSFLLEAMDRIASVADALADQESRKILYRMCAFRLGLDMEYSSFLSNETRYINELTLPALQGRDITYVDCGAYDGDSYEELIAQPQISCKQAFLLEPDPQNFARLVSQVALKQTHAVCLPIAAAETYSILTFNAGQGEACSISLEGAGTSIAAVALDQLLPCMPVDLIKLDVEGAEAQVLRGAEQIIRRSHPVLIVSLYHNPQDLWALPELLFDLCPNYRFYIRQHSPNTFESVLYAVPNQ
ncbi:FkbM family methyltransferase [Pseudomonas tussilaginis]|uniref:FkbM family methyltransferase n=1 Tax=unclassified Pseudomonas TaxID=196821 RepID=UPI000C6CC42C|nr:MULTISPECIES: FkbM family methyltransferase [unclassified Pseudomonas]QYX49776.1 FkbM family methyltransferase [Pseudomonas sp. S11A 273]